MQTNCTYTASEVSERLAEDQVFRQEMIEGLFKNKAACAELLKEAGTHLLELLELLKARKATHLDGR